MAYLALYRKYRPKNFSDVCGQNTIIEILKKSIEKDKIGHAYIFSGPRGTGKTSVAKMFARSVNCLNPINGEACNKCEICKKLDENDIDIIEIDAASNNGVDEIREIRNNSKLSPSFCKYKVYIIDEVHMLSSGAFNALLKTLEEPPKHVIFILATTEIQKIPLTILSRCQKFDYKKIISKNIVERLEKIALEESIKIDNDALELIAEISDGGLRDAINLLDQSSLYCNKIITKNDILDISGSIDDSTIKQLFDTMYNNEIESGIKIINNIYECGKNFVNVAQKLLLFIKDISINNTIHDYFDKMYEEELLKYSYIDSKKSIKISNIIIKLIEELKITNNQKIIFEIYYINILNLINKNNKIISREIIKKSDKKIDKKIDKNQSFQSAENRGLDQNVLKIQINNALATADKNYLMEYQKLLKTLDEYLPLKKYNTVVKILLEGKTVVGSEKYLIIEYSNISYVEIFNKNIDIIHTFFKKELNKNISIIAITSKDWQNIKKEYINNRKNGKKYEIINEDLNKENVYQQNETEEVKTIVEVDAIKIFGKDIINIK